MTIKIIGLCASPRPQGNTLRMLQRLMAQCESLGAQTEIHTIVDHPVDFCVACETCMREGSCPLPDDYLLMLPKILAADALVLATPNYAFGVSAQLKAVMDRSHAFLYYAQAMRGKYGAGLCAGGHWAKTAGIARWCGQAIWLCGGSYVGAVSGISKHRDYKGFTNEKRVHARIDRLARRLVAAIKNKKTYTFQQWLRDTFIIHPLWRGLAKRKTTYPWIARQIREQQASKDQRQ